MAEAPQQWDWAAADIPSALTPELEDQQQAKEVRMHMLVALPGISSLFKLDLPMCLASIE